MICLVLKAWFDEENFCSEDYIRVHSTYFWLILERISNLLINWGQSFAVTAP